MDKDPIIKRNEQVIPSSGEAVLRNSTFKDFVTLGVPMPVAEAVQQLATFRGLSAEAILGAFLNLRNAEPGDTATFGESVSNGSHCLKIQICDSSGRFKVFSLLDAETGRFIPHIS